MVGRLGYHLEVPRLGNPEASCLDQRHHLRGRVAVAHRVAVVAADGGIRLKIGGGKTGHRDRVAVNNRVGSGGDGHRRLSIR